MKTDQQIDASIIILTKNAGKNFGNILELVLNQKFKGIYEVIIIDSGSTDKTIEIAKRYSVRIELIKLFMESGKFCLMSR